MLLRKFGAGAGRLTLQSFSSRCPPGRQPRSRQPIFSEPLFFAFPGGRHYTVKPRGILSRWFKSPEKSGPPYNHFVQIGDPVLRARCEEVPKQDIKSKHVQQTLQYMQYVLEKHDGVGISAPQIGVPLRIIMYRLTRQQLRFYLPVEQEKRGMKVLPLTVIINPKMKIIDTNQILHREGCCSFHGHSCLVPRARHIQVSGYTPDGEDIELTARDWTARIIQHEVDHLDGVLILDKTDPSSVSMDYWHVVNHRQGNFKLSYSGIQAGPKKWFTSSLFWKSS